MSKIFTFIRYGWTLIYVYMNPIEPNIYILNILHHIFKYENCNNSDIAVLMTGDLLLLNHLKSKSLNYKTVHILNNYFNNIR